MSPPEPAQTPAAPDLAALRGEIDRIDGAMHALLMERGEIIDRLIAVKRRQGGGSAFRPDREASMMRALAERHRGILPLHTAEGIWRVIIATFTFVQAPFRVHADISGGDAPMRDSARFHFGFTVPYVPHASAEAVIAAVAASTGDLGIFRPDRGASSDAWWTALAGAEKPKVIARLPFIERRDHPAGTPVFVVSKPLADAALRETVLVCIRAERWRESARSALAGLGADIIGSAGAPGGLAILAAVSGEVGLDRIRATLADAGVGRIDLDEIGSHANRFRVEPTQERAAPAAQSA